MAQEGKKYQSLKEFWPFYLGEHTHPLNRLLHFVGSTLVLGLVGLAIYLQNWWILLACPVAGYGFAWFGHFFVEKNRPATFTYPVKSLVSDWIMWAYMLTGRLRGEIQRAGVQSR